MRYSVKMRASQRTDHDVSADHHLSGAERIVSAAHVTHAAEGLITRALDHPRGTADDISVSLHRIADDDICRVSALQRAEVSCTNPAEADSIITSLLDRWDVTKDVATEALTQLRTMRQMRGAILLDADSGDRLDLSLTDTHGAPLIVDPQRGVRVTALDHDHGGDDRHIDASSFAKSYYFEAMTLAAKVAAHPAVVAELCISDDPDYTTGYIAGAGQYFRIPNIKPAESAQGGRVFLVRGTDSDLVELVNYLQHTPVIVTGIPPLPAPQPAATESTTLPLQQWAAEKLQAWEAAGLRRHPKTFASAQDPAAVIDGQSRLLFASSNYLGLATDPVVTAAAADALKHYGAGSGGSRLTTGTTDIHRQVEAQLAQWMGTDDAVFFATGYSANLSTIDVLATGDELAIFADQRNHASLIDGTRMARRRGATIEIFPHGDYQELDRQLGQCTTVNKLVVSDGVFSMDGDCADVAQLVARARRHGAWVMLDDAHGVGTMGPTGAGLCELVDADLRPDIVLGTASKALGVEGGFIATSQPLAELIRNRARSYVFSTAPTPATMAAVGAAVRRIVDSAGRADSPVARLQHNARYLREVLVSHQLIGPSALSEPATPIVPIFVGDEAAAMAVADHLWQRGIHAPAIRYPTVARGQAIIRATVMANHTETQLQTFGDELAASIAAHREAH